MMGVTMRKLKQPSGQDLPLLTPKQKRQLGAMVELGQESPGDALNALVSRALTLCPLPYRKPKESQLSREMQLPIGSLRVTFSDMTNAKNLSYGDDALVLDLLASEARFRKDRVITFRTAKDLLLFMGVNPDERGMFSGTTFKQTLQRVDRLRRLGIAVQWNRPDGEALEIYRVFSRSLTPSSTDAEREKLGEQSLFPYFLEFSDEFFAELMSHYRAIPREVLLNFRGSPTEYALAKFIVDRVATAKSVSTVPLEDLRDERGSNDSNLTRFRHQLRNVLVKLSAWEANFHPDHGKWVRITTKGLRIGPMTAALGDAAAVENTEK
jgi:hypothetical protein